MVNYQKGQYHLAFRRFHALKKSRVTLLPRNLPLKLSNHLSMLPTSRTNLELEFSRVGEDTRLRLHVHIYLFPILSFSLCEVKGSQRLDLVDVKTRVSEEATRAFSSAVAKSLRCRIRLIARRKETIRIKNFGASIHLWVMKKPPDCWKNICAFGYQVIVELDILRSCVWKPMGAMGHHLRTSLTKALTYGRLSRSSNVGRRSVPTTRSISS